MQRLRIVHTTEIAYDQQIRASHNELRMTPLNEEGQLTLDNRLRIKPLTWSHVYVDHWGTHVTAIECITGHAHLNVEAISTVERVTSPPVESPTRGWEVVRDVVARDLRHEWLMATPHTTCGQELGAVAEQIAEADCPEKAVARAMDLISEHMSYRRGVTGVHSDGESAWAEGAGVCQDYAHILIGVLRSVGIPARYVSGYLVPRSGLSLGETATGESHAWVEYWDGRWYAVDPTNARPVGLDHVVVARGRDYSDVSPFQGVYSGSAQGTSTVEVRITRLA